jgi:hypothetical protein
MHLAIFIWAKGMGGPSIENSFSIAVDYQGNVYTTGFFEGSVDFDPGLGTNLLTKCRINRYFRLKTGYIWQFSMGKKEWVVILMMRVAP